MNKEWLTHFLLDALAEDRGKGDITSETLIKGHMKPLRFEPCFLRLVLEVMIGLASMILYAMITTPVYMYHWIFKKEKGCQTKE